MRSLKILGLAAVVAVMGAVSAPDAGAAVKFSLVGDVVYPLTKWTSDAVDVEGGLGYGGGFFLELGLGKSAGLEFGAVYQVANIVTTNKLVTPNVETTTSSNALHVPLGFRFRTSPRFSIFLGGGMDYSLESTDTDKTSFGLAGGFRINLGKGGGGLFFEPRFTYGLEKEGSAGGFEDKNPMAVVGFLGYAFGK